MLSIQEKYPRRPAIPMRIPIVTFMLALLAACPGPAQESKPPASRQDQIPTFRKNVNLVSLFFNVKGKHSDFVPGLTQDNFEVQEDGKPQTIKYFSAESNQPLTLGMMIDSSISMQRMLPDEKVIAADFLHQVVTDKDLAFVISFDISVDLLQDLTTDIRLLRSGLEKARTNVSGGGGGVPGIGQGPFPVSNPKGTLLYDANYRGSNDILSQPLGPKPITTLTSASHPRTPPT